MLVRPLPILCYLQGQDPDAGYTDDESDDDRHTAASTSYTLVNGAGQNEAEEARRDAAAFTCARCGFRGAEVAAAVRTHLETALESAHAASGAEVMKLEKE